MLIDQMLAQMTSNQTQDDSCGQQKQQYPVQLHFDEDQFKMGIRLFPVHR